MGDWFSFSDFSTGNRYYITEKGARLELKDEDIIRFYHSAIQKQWCKPLLDLVESSPAQRKLISTKIPNGRITHWLKGRDLPSPESVRKIREIPGIDETRLPGPEPGESESKAATIETIKHIRSCRVPPDEAPKISLDLNSLDLLERALQELPMFPKSKVRDEKLSRLATSLSPRFPGMEVTGPTLDLLLCEWLPYYMRFADALTPDSIDDDYNI